MSLKAVFFDLDGTLLDTAPDFIVTMNQLADEYNIPQLPPEKIRQTVSDGSRALVTLAFNLTQHDDGFDERRQRLLDIYYKHMGDHCQLFDGFDEVLNEIKKRELTWGIITNKPARFAEPIVDNLSFPTNPSVLICPDHVTQTKPDPEPLYLACREVACEPHEVIYVGDHRRDIDCGLAAGSHTIAVSFGYIHSDDDINDWNAHHIADHPTEIISVIDNFTTL